MSSSSDQSVEVAAKKEVFSKMKKFIFTKSQLRRSPSSECGVTQSKELQYRHQAANFCQDLGQKLSVNQLCINTSITYMHRFYMVHSFTKMKLDQIVPACVFLAAKVEEQPKKLTHVLKLAWSCMHPKERPLEVSHYKYPRLVFDLTMHEINVLDAIDFQIQVVHPHTHVVKTVKMFKASKEFSQMAYFMATNSLHLTPFSLQYSPVLIGAMCIYLSCKWKSVTIPTSSEGKPFWEYMDQEWGRITEDMLEEITKEFLEILDKYPSRLSKLRNYSVRKETAPANGHKPGTVSSRQQIGHQSSNHPAVNQSSFAERQENSNQIKQGNLNHVAGQKRPASSQLNQQQAKRQTISMSEYTKRKGQPHSNHLCNIDVIPQQLATKLPSLNVATFNNSIMQEWLKRGDQEFLRKFMKNPLLQHRNNHLKSEEHKVLLKLEKDKEERRRRQQHHQAIINSAHKPHQPLPSVPKLKIKFGDSSQPSKTQHQQFKR